MRVPRQFYYLFWDVQPADLDTEKDVRFILERLLELGNDAELRWVINNYQMNDIKEVVMRSRSLSRKTARFWQAYFGLGEEEVRCLSTFYREQESPFWSP